MSDFRDLLTESSRFGESRLFQPLEVGEVVLSIQASAHHYCDPRETLDGFDLFAYRAWEVAVSSAGGDSWNTRWLHPDTDGFPGSEYWESDESPMPVGGWVPTAVVQSIYDYFAQAKEGTDD